MMHELSVLSCTHLECPIHLLFLEFDDILFSSLKPRWEFGGRACPNSCPSPNLCRRFKIHPCPPRARFRNKLCLINYAFQQVELKTNVFVKVGFPWTGEVMYAWICSDSMTCWMWHCHTLGGRLSLSNSQSLIFIFAEMTWNKTKSFFSEMEKNVKS